MPENDGTAIVPDDVGAVQHGDLASEGQSGTALSEEEAAERVAPAADDRNVPDLATAVADPVDEYPERSLEESLTDEEKFRWLQDGRADGTIENGRIVEFRVRS